MMGKAEKSKSKMPGDKHFVILFQLRRDIGILCATDTSHHPLAISLNGYSLKC